MTGKSLIFLRNVLPDVHIRHPCNYSAPLLPEGTAKYTHLAPKQIHSGYQLK